MKKKEYMTNETQTVEKKKDCQLVTLFRNPRKESMLYMTRFCAMLWNKNLVLAVSRI